MGHYAGTQPGWRGTDPDGGTWVRQPGDRIVQWAHFTVCGVYRKRTQEEAEAADLVPLHPAPTEPGQFWVLVGGKSPAAAPAPLDPTWSHYPVAEVEQAVAEELDATLDLVDEERELATAAVVKRLCEFEPAPLDPGNPEHLRQVANFLTALAVTLDWEHPNDMKITPLWLRDKADRLDREARGAERDAKAREVATEIARGCWPFDSFDNAVAALTEAVPVDLSKEGEK